MNYKIQINNSENRYLLFNTAVDSIQQQPILQFLVSGDEIDAAMQEFSELKKISFYTGDSEILAASYTGFNGYTNISYLGLQPYDNGTTYHCFSVLLKMVSIEEQIQEIHKELFKSNVDVESLSMEEYKERVLEKISEDCQTDIFKGTEINGESFTYKTEDQINLKSLFDTLVMVPNLQGVPYHSSGNACRFYSREEIINIYFTLLERLIQITTYCNALILMIKDMNQKPDLSQVTYGMELKESYKNSYEELMTQITTNFNSLKTQYLSNEDTTNESNSSTN